MDSHSKSTISSFLTALVDAGIGISWQEAEAESESAVAGENCVPLQSGGQNLGRLVAASAAGQSLLTPLADLICHLAQTSSQLEDRNHEFMGLVHLSTLLSGQREPDVVLKAVATSVTELLDAKAAAIRMLDDSGTELHIAATHNLSPAYLNKGRIVVDASTVDQQALQGEVVTVDDMVSDSRVVYPDDARREQLRSLLCVGMVYRGKPIGVLRVYTAQPRVFSTAEINLARGIAQLAAAFIRNAQLDSEREEQSRIARQVQLAADVQRQLLPSKGVTIEPFEIFGRYEPCFELGGDFFDYFPLDGGVGIVVGDVVGKGIAAGLLMASVRSTLRAHVENLYDLDVILSRVNVAMHKDTKDTEFATLFYGAIDCKSRRLTYCSAGHEPGLLLRGEKFIDLDVGGLPVGIDGSLKYEKGIVDLQPGDVLVLHSDGVTDGSNFQGERFGRDRIRKAMRDMAAFSARDVANHVLWETRRFVGLNYRPDDMTILAVKVH